MSIMTKKSGNEMNWLTDTKKVIAIQKFTNEKITYNGKYYSQLSTEEQNQFDHYYFNVLIA